MFTTSPNAQRMNLMEKRSPTASLKSPSYLPLSVNFILKATFFMSESYIFSKFADLNRPAACHLKMRINLLAYDFTHVQVDHCITSTFGRILIVYSDKRMYNNIYENIIYGKAGRFGSQDSGFYATTQLKKMCCFFKRSFEEIH